MKKLVKSPLNYVGGKYKLLPQILPLFPKEIDCFVDLFGGGFNVGANVEATHIIYNEYNEKVYELVKGICTEDLDTSFDKIMNIVNKFSLNKTNEQGYYALRDEYNSSKDKPYYKLYSLITHAFNYQIRFNKSGGYNMPFGKNRSSFSKSLQNKYKEFVLKVQSKEVEFSNNCFSQITSLPLDNSDLVYVDPPYLITQASYNESGGWNEDMESELLCTLDYLNKNNIKFALSNVIEAKGKTNELLKKWSEKYNIHELNYSYNNCNYQRKDKNKENTIEVLITNY